MKTTAETQGNAKSKVRSLRLEEGELNKILDTLDEREDEASASNRKSERFRFRRPNILIQIKQPGDGSSQTFYCHSRDLSSTGISVLHGGYVHVGSRCVIQLITSHGAWDNIPGIVARCCYLQSNIHEVGIRFERDIEPGSFCPAAVRLKVLVVEDQSLMAKLTAKILAQANALIEIAGNGQEALETIGESGYDLILTDIEMPVMDGFAFVTALRDRGYGGLIVALTSLTSEKDRVRCLEAGCNDVLQKPPRLEDLQGILDSLKREPVLSSLADDLSMRELISEFVLQLPQKLNEIRQAQIQCDSEALNSLARRLRHEASGFGFEPIADSARGLECAIVHGEPSTRVKKLVADLASCCHLARSTAPRN